MAEKIKKKKNRASAISKMILMPKAIENFSNIEIQYQNLIT